MIAALLLPATVPAASGTGGEADSQPVEASESVEAGLEPISTLLSTVRTRAPANPPNPICSLWRDQFGRTWHLTSWDDRDGNGKLSKGDIVDFRRVIDGNDVGPVLWASVRTLANRDGQLFSVWQIIEPPTDDPPSALPVGTLLEWARMRAPVNPPNPICSLWRDQFGRIWHLTSWDDRDHDGKLSKGDVVDFKLVMKGADTGPTNWSVVREISSGLGTGMATVMAEVIPAPSG